MGEVAEMMLDGELCESCGEFLGDGVGFPRQCHDCARDARKAGQTMRADGFGTYQNVTPVNARALDRARDGFVKDPNGNLIYRPNKANCPECGKIVKRAGLRDHMKTVHGFVATTRCPKCNHKVKIGGLDHHLRDAHGEHHG